MNFKLIKSVGVTLLCCFALSCTVSARTDFYTVSESDGTVTLNVKNDEGDVNFAVIVTKPGQTMDTITQTAPLKVFPVRFQGEKGVAAVKSTNLGILSEEGMYTVYAGGGSTDKNMVLNFCVSGDSGAALTALNTELTAAGLKNVLLNPEYNRTVWCIDNAKAGQAEVCNAFAGLKKEQYPKGFSCVQDVQQCFNNACALAEFAKSKEYTLKELAAWYKDDLELILTAENGLGHILDGNKNIEAAFESIRSDAALNPITSISELKRVLEKSEAVGMMNGATRENIESVWTTYGKTLGIIANDGSYTNPYFGSVSSYEIAKLVVRDGSKSKFTSISDVKKAFDDAIVYLIDKKNTGQGGTVSGGGSGGGSVGGFGGGSGAVSIGESALVKNPGVLAGMQHDTEISEIFKDLPVSHWACRQLEYAAKVGIINGDGDGNCRPDSAVSRAEFIQMIANAFELERPATASPKLDILQDNGTKPKPESQNFSDVPQDAWYSRAIDLGTRAGVINGYDDGSFGVYDTITRQDAATVLMRVKESCSVVISGSVDEVEFVDEAEIAEYAIKAVTALQKYGVLKGYEDGTFRPTGELTRAEAVTLIYTIRRLSNSL